MRKWKCNPEVILAKMERETKTPIVLLIRDGWGVSPSPKSEAEAEGNVVEDISAPHLKSGFDLKVLRTVGLMRYVEVEGRTGTQAFEMTRNEWAQAANHPDRYWL